MKAGKVLTLSVIYFFCSLACSLACIILHFFKNSDAGGFTEQLHGVPTMKLIGHGLRKRASKVSHHRCREKLIKFKELKDTLST